MTGLHIIAWCTLIGLIIAGGLLFERARRIAPPGALTGPLHGILAALILLTLLIASLTAIALTGPAR